PRLHLHVPLAASLPAVLVSHRLPARVTSAQRSSSRALAEAETPAQLSLEDLLDSPLGVGLEHLARDVRVDAIDRYVADLRRGACGGQARLKLVLALGILLEHPHGVRVRGNGLRQ